MDDLDRPPQYARLQNRDTMTGRLRKLRFKLIRRLAGDDLVVLNALQVTQPGYKLCKKDLDQAAIVAGVTFHTEGPFTPVPGILILEHKVRDQ